MSAALTIDEFFDLLAQPASQEVRNNLSALHEACRRYFESGGMDFNIDEIGAVSERSDGPTRASVRRNKAYKKLILGWSSFAASGTVDLPAADETAAEVLGELPGVRPAQPSPSDWIMVVDAVRLSARRGWSKSEIAREKGEGVFKWACRFGHAWHATIDGAREGGCPGCAARKRKK